MTKIPFQAEIQNGRPLNQSRHLLTNCLYLIYRTERFAAVGSEGVRHVHVFDYQYGQLPGVSAEMQPVWTQQLRDFIDGSGEESETRAALKTEDETGGAAAREAQPTTTGLSCTAIKSATVVVCEPIVVATFPFDAVLPPGTNPWNASAHVWAIIQEPSGVSPVRVGGYFDNGSISFRYTPLKAGRYTVTLHRRDNLSAPPPCNFVAVASPEANCGFVTVGTNNQHFAVSKQQSWFGIGENLAWVTPVAGKNHQSLHDWDPYLKNLSAVGANYIRVWLTDSAWDDMTVETALGNYSVANTARIESLLTSSHALGIKALMTIESFNYLCVCKKRKQPGGECTSPCYFDKFVYNVDHPGGFLHDPAEFFNSSLADDYFQMRLRCKYTSNHSWINRAPGWLQVPDVFLKDCL